MGLGKPTSTIKVFQKHRFGEPTLDMILDLYIADREHRRVDVSSLCLASGVAPTTALRYVNLLMGNELITKVDDADDGRRLFVNISYALRTAIDDRLDESEAGLRCCGVDSSVDQDIPPRLSRQ